MARKLLVAKASDTYGTAVRRPSGVINFAHVRDPCEAVDPWKRMSSVGCRWTRLKRGHEPVWRDDVLLLLEGLKAKFDANPTQYVTRAHLLGISGQDGPETSFGASQEERV